MAFTLFVMFKEQFAENCHAYPQCWVWLFSGGFQYQASMNTNLNFTGKL